MKKRILFLYISIASGHQRAAEAMMHAMRMMDPSVETQGIDAFTYAYPIVGRLVAKIYIEMVRRIPQIWNYLYDNPSVEESTRETRELLNVINSVKLRKLLKRFRPDCLVCTQAIPASVVAAEKRRGKIHLPVVGIVTDYAVHTYWLYKEIDMYIVATEEIKRDMIQRGIKENRIYVTGIPIDPRFAHTGSKFTERAKLEMDLHKPVVLVMGGSQGLGPMEDIVKALREISPPVQVIAICGRNRKSFNSLKKLFVHDRNVKIFGYVKNLFQTMDAADILVSKPGGLTCAEAAAKGLPLVMVKPIPGQEERNARYLLKQGAAVRIETLNELKREVAHLIQHPLRLRKLSDRMKAISRPYAAFDANNLLLRIIGKRRY